MNRLHDDEELDGIVRRAVGYIDEFHRYAEAERIVRPALLAHPDDLNLIKLLGEAQRQQDRPDEALETFEAGLRLDPDDEFLHHLRSKALSKLGRDTEAVAAMARAVEIAPHDYYHGATYGSMLARDGQHRQAVEVYRTVLDEYPGDPMLLSMLGDCLLDMDEYAEAHDLLTAAITAEPDDSDSHWSLAFCQMDLSRARDSLLSLAEAARLAPDDARRCAIAAYLLPWPISVMHESLRPTLPLAGIGAVVSTITGSPIWLQWIVTALTVVALGYSTHWLARGGVTAWRALFRLNPAEIAVTGLGIGLGYAAATAVLAGTWAPDPLLAASGLTGAAMLWIVAAIERQFHPDTDHSVPVLPRILRSLRNLTRNYRTFPRQLRERHRLLRSRR